MLAEGGSASTFNLYRFGSYSNGSWSFASLTLEFTSHVEHSANESGSNDEFSAYERNDAYEYDYALDVVGSGSVGSYTETALETTSRTFDGTYTGGGTISDSSLITLGFTNSGTVSLASGELAFSSVQIAEGAFPDLPPILEGFDFSSSGGAPSAPSFGGGMDGPSAGGGGGVGGSSGGDDSGGEQGGGPKGPGGGGDEGGGKGPEGGGQQGGNGNSGAAPAPGKPVIQGNPTEGGLRGPEGDEKRVIRRPRIGSSVGLQVEFDYFDAMNQRVEVRLAPTSGRLIDANTIQYLKVVELEVELDPDAALLARLADARKANAPKDLYYTPATFPQPKQDDPVGDFVAKQLGFAGGPRESGSVGQPGFWESLIPFWGSGRAAVDNFQNGEYGAGVINTGLAISDVFLLRTLLKGGWKLGGKVVGTAAEKEAGQIAAEGVAKTALEHTVKEGLEHAPVGRDLFGTIRGQDFSRLTNKQIGDLGENVGRNFLQDNHYTDIFAVQNRSGNGIDIVARTRDGRLAFFEVKASSTGNIGSLSPRQGDMNQFVRDVLRDAARGQGRFRNIDAATRGRAQSALDAFNAAPQSVSGTVIGIDLQNEIIRVSPWR